MVLDVDLATAGTRLNSELDRMEQKGDVYHQKVREGFLELAKGRDDVVVIDAQESIEQVHRMIVKKIGDCP